MSEICVVPEGALPSDVWINQKSFRLYVPVRDGEPTEGARLWISRVRELGLGVILPIIHEACDGNLDFLRCCCDCHASSPTPYLQETVEREVGAVIFFVGDEIAQGLCQLDAAFGHRVSAVEASSQTGWSPVNGEAACGLGD
jgi:hypothetical protein